MYKVDATRLGVCQLAPSLGARTGCAARCSCCAICGMCSAERRVLRARPRLPPPRPPDDLHARRKKIRVVIATPLVDSTAPQPARVIV